MRRGTTPRRHVARGRSAYRRFVQLGVVASCNGFLSCAPPSHYEQPATLQGYEILITRRDSLGQEIARGLRHHGFKVWSRVRGGSRPTVYLLTFTFRETDPQGLTWLHVRLADTRTGGIVAAVSIPLDSVELSAAARARVIVDSLAANAALRRAS